MSSKIVLGAAEYGTLTNREIDCLLSTAIENNIQILDTAHGYSGSEEKIGYFANRDKLLINTKIGWPDPTIFTPKGIRRSLDESLSRLQLERINTFFIHSLSENYLTHDNILTLVNLKVEGKIQNIGYSGDGSDLKSAISIYDFDEYMATFNIIDQTNYALLEAVEESKIIYFKHVLAKLIWKQFTLKRRIQRNTLVRTISRKQPLPESFKDYCDRFSRLQPYLPDKNRLLIFLEFALFQGNRNRSVILGTRNPIHLLEAREIEDSFDLARTEEFLKYSN
jgi:aryl-alcohol dehydrogenase-like predicted oxidoreductase